MSDYQAPQISVEGNEVNPRACNVAFVGPVAVAAGIWSVVAGVNYVALVNVEAFAFVHVKGLGPSC